MMWMLPSQLCPLSRKIHRGPPPSSQLSVVLHVLQQIPHQRAHLVIRAAFLSTKHPSCKEYTEIKSIDADKVTDASSFRRNREALAQHWLSEFDTVAFGGRLLQTNASIGSPIVSLKWSNRLRTTAGRAHLMRETTRRRRLAKEVTFQSHESSQPRRTAVIELSAKVVDAVERLKITLLHEMCHAAAWIVDGTIRPPHGPGFQKWAQQATAAIPSIAITTKHNFKIQYKYSWTCVTPSCSVHIIGRHGKRSINVDRHVCGKCHGPLQVVTPDTATRNSEKKAASRPLSEYHQFVQKHAKVVARQLQEKLRDRATMPLLVLGRKKSMAPRKVSPQKVMKETARLWQKQKKQTSMVSLEFK